MKWLPIIEDLRHYLISCLHSGNVYDTPEANIMWTPDIGKQGTQDIKDKKLDWLFQRNQHDFFGWLLSPSLEYDVCCWCLIFCPWYFLCSFFTLWSYIDLQNISCHFRRLLIFVNWNLLAVLLNFQYSHHIRNFPIKSYWRHLRTKILKARRKVLR